MKVRMYATVREAAGTAEVELEASNLVQVAELLGARFGEPIASMLRGFPHDSETLVVLVNGRNVSGPGTRAIDLREGDEISVFPPVSGG